ncbi:MAG: indolepyruvate oxidoreductase subunit beta [Bacteroidales bacterium]
MKTDIILAGVGGQGILTIATAIGAAAIKKNLYLKQAEVHGMSQRGGAVQSHLRLSNRPVASDLIPRAHADLILSVEPMESLRYLSYLSEDGWLVANEEPYKNIDDYPAMETIMNEITSLPHYVLLNADQIARKLGSPRSSNIVMLGAAIPFINGLDAALMEDGIRQVFAQKGKEVVEVNLQAFRAGLQISEEKTKKI